MSHILTATGRYFNFRAPELHSYQVEDIAHALSRLCRYTGHCKKFYSVAQHSVLVSYYVPEELALEGLLHDASEAYLGDVSSPLKALLPDYKAIEKSVEQAIALHFDLHFPHPAIIKEVDLRMLVTEMRDNMPVAVEVGPERPPYEPYEMLQIKPVNHREAKKMFLARYNELIGKR